MKECRFTVFHINRISLHAPFLNPLKTSEKRKVFQRFQRVERLGTNELSALGTNGLS